jgi:hypothetical protein
MTPGDVDCKEYLGFYCNHPRISIKSLLGGFQE